MNKSGNMTSVKLTYGVSENDKVGKGSSAFLNYPNKSKEILKKKARVQSKILEQAADPRKN
jgi:hypothetical protein